MGDLSVRVELHGQLVEDHVLPLVHVARIGEAANAAVGFPGADIAISRVGRQIHFRGRVLEEGDSESLSLGAITVHLHHIAGGVRPEWAGSLDRRFFLVAVVVVLVGSWLEAARAWLEVETDWVPTTALVDRIDGRESSVRLGVLEPLGGEGALEDGPQHLADDHRTGTGWYRWYRHVVPVGDSAVGATERLALDPSDASARRIIAQVLYDAEEHEDALWHFGRLVQRDATDHRSRVQMARSARRLGRHEEEMRGYRTLLAADPLSPDALAGLSTALVRMGRLDEAAVLLDDLQAVAPMWPYTDLTLATVAALKGQDPLALAAIDRAMDARKQLSQDLQVELRRDLALDPAFARLRGDPRLISLVNRHLGAAGPRPVR
jgi:thioredoxin-like negative regulator of GroEL